MLSKSITFVFSLVLICPLFATESDDTVEQPALKEQDGKTVIQAIDFSYEGDSDTEAPSLEKRTDIDRLFAKYGDTSDRGSGNTIGAGNEAKVLYVKAKEHESENK